MGKKRILVIEDDKDIQELVRYNLEKEGYAVTLAASGEAGLKAVDKKIPDLVVLDLMLPGIDGFDVCRRLRSEGRTQAVPIIILSAKGEETDIVTGLEVGADDYVTKPFSPKVLLARIRAVSRRKSRPPVADDDVVRIEDLTIHPGRHEVLVDGEKVDLTLTEFRILHLLARRPGWVYTRFQIVERVHGDHYPVTERSVDVQIVGLRKKLGKAGDRIETVRGVGYRFAD